MPVDESCFLRLRKQIPGPIWLSSSKSNGEQEVTNASQLMHMFTAGNQQRKVGGTKMNAESSRSHSVFSILLEVNRGMAEVSYPSGTSESWCCLP